MDKQIKDEKPLVHVLLDERDIKTTYTNGFRTNYTHDEVSVDFAYNFPYPDPSGAVKAQAMFKVSDRMVMVWPSLKRLGQTIDAMSKVREAKYGEIETDEPKRQER
jgi:hypothetical protein